MAISSVQRQLSLTVVWAVITALLVLIVQTIGVDQAFGDDGQPVAAGIAIDYPLAAPEVEQDLPTALYAGLLWSVADSRITSGEGLLGNGRVELDLLVTNTLTVTELRASSAMLGLVAADGQAVNGTNFQIQGARLSVAPGETTPVTVAFDVTFDQNPDPAALALQIGEPGRVPVQIPLAGSTAPTTAPVFAAVDTTPATLADPDDTGRQIVITPTGARIDVNAGPLRAPEGQRLALIKVDLQRTERTSTAAYLTPSWWTLETNAGPASALLVAPEPNPSADNANEITLVFAYPADATDLALVADPAGDAARFPVILPAAG